MVTTFDEGENPIESAKSGILFPVLCGGAERIDRDEGELGKIEYREKCNKNRVNYRASQLF